MDSAQTPSAVLLYRHSFSFFLTIAFIASQASAAPTRAVPDTFKKLVFQDLRRSEHSEDFRSSAPNSDSQSATSASGFKIDLPGIHELTIATIPNGSCHSSASSSTNDGGSSSSASSSSQGQDCAADASAHSDNGSAVDGAPSAPANNDSSSSLDLNSVATQETPSQSSENVDATSSIGHTTGMPLSSQTASPLSTTSQSSVVTTSVTLPSSLTTSSGLSPSQSSVDPTKTIPSSSLNTTLERTTSELNPSSSPNSQSSTTSTPAPSGSNPTFGTDLTPNVPGLGNIGIILGSLFAFLICILLWCFVRRRRLRRQRVQQLLVPSPFLGSMNDSVSRTEQNSGANEKGSRSEVSALAMSATGEHESAVEVGRERPGMEDIEKGAGGARRQSSVNDVESELPPEYSA
ncbi:hypothetical protein VKT23_008054 [Stygiomarasmius scandens]|uniref:Uncharacterized protein n=1 Tax=Marasmiellus scandens TaxID=2682957 RepID=A0ABR1JNV2_9AGAR